MKVMASTVNLDPYTEAVTGTKDKKEGETDEAARARRR